MRENRVKSKVESGAISIGTFMFEFNTSGVGRLAAEAGAEFAVFDMEHTGWSLETIRMLIATTRSTEMVPYVRIPTTEYDFVARALDVGTLGIMTPMVETVEQAQLLVDAAKYPPTGRRGAAFGVAHDDYSGGDINEKIQTANARTHMIMQIETAKGVENAEAIAAIDGVDVLWIGHFDLSLSLGIPGQFDHPTFRNAMQRVLEACDRHGKTPGFMASDLAHGQTLLDAGFRMIAYGGDLWLYQTALRNGLSALNEHAAKMR